MKFDWKIERDLKKSRHSTSVSSMLSRELDRDEGLHWDCSRWKLKRITVLKWWSSLSRKKRVFFSSLLSSPCSGWFVVWLDCLVRRENFDEQFIIVWFFYTFYFVHDPLNNLVWLLLICWLLLRVLFVRSIIEFIADIEEEKIEEWNDWNNFNRWYKFITHS